MLTLAETTADWFYVSVSAPHPLPVEDVCACVYQKEGKYLSTAPRINSTLYKLYKGKFKAPLYVLTVISQHQKADETKQSWSRSESCLLTQFPELVIT